MKNYKALYEALVALTKDVRTPPDILMRQHDLTKIDLVTLVSDTGAKHYRMLGMLPPSELSDSVQDFYDSLESAGLAEIVRKDGRAVGCIPNFEISHLALNVPCYGEHWHAFHPEVLDRLG